MGVHDGSLEATADTAAGLSTATEVLGVLVGLGVWGGDGGVWRCRGVVWRLPGAVLYLDSFSSERWGRGAQLVLVVVVVF
jgi:hypothetical protein